MVARFHAALICALLSLPAIVAALPQAGADAEVILVGAPHAALAPTTTRDEALALLDARAADFLDDVRARVALAGGEVVAEWPSVPAAQVRAPAATLAALATQTGGRIVEDAPDAIRADPFADEAAAFNTGGRRMVQAEDAWALGFRGEGVRIAVIDTGIDPTHEAFRQSDGSTRIVAWRDVVASQPTPYDDSGHGTHVAGAAAGSDAYVDPTFGSFQEAGVAPGATILAAKFLNSAGSGSIADALTALDWAFTNGADVATAAWGGACNTSMLPVLQQVRTLTDLGMVTVAAAGGGGPAPSSVGAPACSESAISVGAITSAHEIYGPSARGPCSDPERGTQPRVCPDLVAKGAAVRSSVPRGACGLCDPSGYRSVSGSSPAAGSAAGVVAIIEQMKRATTGEGWNTTARAEEQVLKQTALDLGAPGPDDTFGWGLPQIMNVHAILAAVPEARIIATFGVGAPILRSGDAATLHFGVLNTGAAVATGSFRATLTHPGGSVESIADRAVALGLLDRADASRVFTVAAGTLPGTYVFRGSLDYTWTNATTGDTVHDVVLREATFEVRRVLVEPTLDGLATRATPGALQHLVLTAENRGNDDATSVEVRLTFPDDYAVLPPDGFDPLAPHGRWASPAPDQVHEDGQFGRVTLTWRVGALAAGEQRAFKVDVLPTTPAANRFVALALACDAVGACGTRSLVATQTVAFSTP